MKSDIDRLMAERGLDGLIVAGGETPSSPRHYLSNGAKITGGLIIKKPGEEPVMVVNPMETEEAAKSGLKVYSNYDMGWAELYNEAEGNVTKTTIAFWGHCLESMGIASGKIGVYGAGDLNFYIELIRLMEQHYAQYHFAGEIGESLFDTAYLTKDADELAVIKSVAARTNAVVQATWDFIAGHTAKDGTVVNSDGSALTIGAVKRFVLRELLERGLEDTGMIFAQGRDAGFPHSRGEDDMALKTGQIIVFDLFPREFGGGYHHDMTRTWCIGHAPDAARELFETVQEAFDIAVEVYGVNKPTHLMQEAVLDYFEANGHPTTRSDPRTTTGYMHSLGHGLGLNIHENPRINHLSKKDVFEVGNVFTIEPGLYYPERGLGARIEDTVCIGEDGQLVTLTTFHKELVLPLKSKA
jgi:Xaa-Pro aminopeptidase